MSLNRFRLEPRCFFAASSQEQVLCDLKNIEGFWQPQYMAVFGPESYFISKFRFAPHFLHFKNIKLFFCVSYHTIRGSIWTIKTIYQITFKNSKRSKYISEMYFIVQFLRYKESKIITFRFAPLYPIFNITTKMFRCNITSFMIEN